ncbi:hypothetical protein HK096_005574, partial [Nowakowskiella sp. JEL0078]
MIDGVIPPVERKKQISNAALTLTQYEISPGAPKKMVTNNSSASLPSQLSSGTSSRVMALDDIMSELDDAIRDLEPARQAKTKKQEYCAQPKIFSSSVTISLTPQETSMVSLIPSHHYQSQNLYQAPTNSFTSDPYTVSSSQFDSEINQHQSSNDLSSRSITPTPVVSSFYVPPLSIQFDTSKYSPIQSKVTASPVTEDITSILYQESPTTSSQIFDEVVSSTSRDDGAYSKKALAMMGVQSEEELTQYPFSKSSRRNVAEKDDFFSDSDRESDSPT